MGKDCDKCGRVYHECMPCCAYCFDGYSGGPGPLFTAGMATVDKAWQDKECPLEADLAAAEAREVHLREGLERIKEMSANREDRVEARLIGVNTIARRCLEGGGE